MATVNQVGNSLTGSTGSGAFVGATSPVLVTPTLGAATATSINFGASTLSTYSAAGSWTPTFTCATVGDLSVAYTTQYGSYTRIGNIVILNVGLLCTPTFSTASGQIRIAGLPYSSISGTQGQFGICTNTSGVTYTVGSTTIMLSIGAGANYLVLYVSGSAFNAATLPMTSIVSAAAIQINGTIVYLAT